MADSIKVKFRPPLEYTIQETESIGKTMKKQKLKHAKFNTSSEKASVIERKDGLFNISSTDLSNQVERSPNGRLNKAASLTMERRISKL